MYANLYVNNLLFYYNMGVFNITNAIFLFFFKKFKKLYNFFSIAFIFFLLILFLSLCFSSLNIIKYKLIYKHIIVFILFYLITSTFIFLNKEANSGAFNSKIRKFWKRSYSIFWLLEFGVFFIFISFYFIHFEESFYFLNVKPEPYINSIISTYVLVESIIILVIVFLGYTKIMLNKNNSNLFLLFFVIITLLTIIFFFDFKNLFFLVNYINNNYTISVNYIHTITYNNIIKNNINLFYLFIIFFLKFWHIFFIYNYFLFFQNIFINRKKISYESISSNNQNFLFIMIFNYIIYLLYLYSLLFEDVTNTWYLLYKTDITNTAMDILIEFGFSSKNIIFIFFYKIKKILSWIIMFFFIFILKKFKDWGYHNKIMEELNIFSNFIDNLSLKILYYIYTVRNRKKTFLFALVIYIFIIFFHKYKTFYFYFEIFDNALIYYSIFLLFLYSIFFFFLICNERSMIFDKFDYDYVVFKPKMLYIKILLTILDLMIKSFYILYIISTYIFIIQEFSVYNLVLSLSINMLFILFCIFTIGRFFYVDKKIKTSNVRTYYKTSNVIINTILVLYSNIIYLLSKKTIYSYFILFIVLTFNIFTINFFKLELTFSQLDYDLKYTLAQVTFDLFYIYILDDSILLNTFNIIYRILKEEIFCKQQMITMTLIIIIANAILIWLDTDKSIRLCTCLHITYFVMFLFIVTLIFLRFSPSNSPTEVVLLYQFGINGLISFLKNRIYSNKPNPDVYVFTHDNKLFNRFMFYYFFTGSLIGAYFYLALWLVIIILAIPAKCFYVYGDISKNIINFIYF